MSYCFVRITNYYPNYLRSFYDLHPEASGLDYDTQYAKLVKDSLDLVSSYSREFNKLPGIRAVDIVSNAQPLQSAWKLEHQLPSDLSRSDLVIEQLKVMSPDVIWIDDFSIVSLDWREKLRKAVPQLKLILGHICAPYNENTERKFRQLDIILSCIPCMVDELKGRGHNSILLYHSFNPEILQRIEENNNKPETDLLFTGSLYSGPGFHNSRLEYIEEILKSGIHITLYCNLEDGIRIFLKRVLYAFMKIISSLGVSFLLKKFSIIRKLQPYGEAPVKSYSKKLIRSTRSPVFGISLFQLMSKAKITFNNHGEVAGNCAGNIRMFEVTGVGSCLVTDWKKNITDIFEPGKEIVTYKTIEECIEKLRWLLDNPEECKKIAKAGQERTLRNHCVAERVKFLNDVIHSELERKNKEGRI